MHQELKSQVHVYLKKNSHAHGSRFVQHIKQVFREGRLDNNHIRKAMIDCYNSHDKTAVFVGSVLLQLDRHELSELLQE